MGTHAQLSPAASQLSIAGDRSAKAASETSPEATQAPGDSHDEQISLQPLSLVTRLTFALPAFSTTSLTILISLYANILYVRVGTSLAFLSFFTALARSFDVITDPLMGWISDTTISRFGIQGRRRPYMFVGPFFYGIFFTALFWPPPFYPSTPGDDKEFSPGGDFSYGSNLAGPDDDPSNAFAGYWFGIFYILFYLADTFTNVPYEALGPELHTDTDERAKLFFTQKLLNMFGMIVGAISPPMIAVLFRWRDWAEVQVPCDYLFHPGSNATHLLHGQLDDQLLYVDDLQHGVVNKSAEFCISGEGDFCYEKLFEDGTHYWFEQGIKTIETTCTGAPGNATLDIDRYEMSSLAADQLGFVITAAAFGLYHLLAMQLLVARTTERTPSSKSHSRLPLVSSIMRSLNNAAFRPLLGAWALDGLALAALVTMFPFYVTYVIQPEGLEAQEKDQEMNTNVCMAVFVLILLVTAMISSVGWLWLAKRVGKFPAWQAFNFINAITNLSFFLVGEGDSYRILATGFLNGLPVGGQFLVNTIMSDVIDYDEFLNGVRSEGAFSVFATLIPKFVAIPASSVPMAMIFLLGFRRPVSGVVQPQNDSVKRFIQICFVMLPFSCAVLSFVLKFLYPIKKDRIAREIQRGVQKFRNGATTVRDPVLNADVPQRSFPPEEDKQAAAMEMYSVSQLERYRNLLMAVPPHVVSAANSTAGTGEHLTPFVDFQAILLAPVRSCGIAMVVSVAATGASFPLLTSQKSAIVPILCCIIFGVTVSLLGVATIRWLAARRLQYYQLFYDVPKHFFDGKVGRVPAPRSSAYYGASSGAEGVHPDENSEPQASTGEHTDNGGTVAGALERHISVIGTVLLLKRRGAAGGFNATMRSTVLASGQSEEVTAPPTDLSSLPAPPHPSLLPHSSSPVSMQATTRPVPEVEISAEAPSCPCEAQRHEDATSYDTSASERRNGDTKVQQ